MIWSAPFYGLLLAQELAHSSVFKGLQEQVPGVQVEVCAGEQTPDLGFRRSESSSLLRRSFLTLMLLCVGVRNPGPDGGKLERANGRSAGRATLGVQDRRAMGLSRHRAQMAQDAF